jgi:aminomethyltransferase
VVVRVGYARGPEVARRLEGNNIICNYQTAPEEEGFTAAGALRLGVSEMTRFGMDQEGFRTLASLMATVVKDPKASVTTEVKKLREQYSELQFCFRGDEYDEAVQRLHQFL